MFTNGLCNLPGVLRSFRFFLLSIVSVVSNQHSPTQHVLPPPRPQPISPSSSPLPSRLQSPRLSFSSSTGPTACSSTPEAFVPPQSTSVALRRPQLSFSTWPSRPPVSQRPSSKPPSSSHQRSLEKRRHRPTAAIRNLIVGIQTMQRQVGWAMKITCILFLRPRSFDEHS
jgi:hypothetical protein